MILFIKLFLAHLIGDFLLQSNRWVAHIEVNKVASKYLYFHVLLHFVVTMILVWDFRYWQIALILMVSHYGIDLLKMYTAPLFKNKSVIFFIDQILHVIVLYCCAYFENLWEHTLSLFQQLDWALITAIVFVSFPTAIIMKKIMQIMFDPIEIGNKSLPNAGKYIGIIERLLVLVFIILERWEVIGLLITAKSVFRFNDLKENNSIKLTEYILIGTLLSFGIAIITGIIYAGVNV